MSQIFEIQDNLYYLGEPVIYSVYPSVINGTGIITPDGIKSTGQTLRDVTAMGLGDICTFDAVYDIRPDSTRPRMVYDPLAEVWRSAYNMPTRQAIEEKKSQA